MILFLFLFVQLRRVRNFVFESFNLFSSFVPTLESSKKLSIRVCFSFFFFSFIPTRESSEELCFRVYFKCFFLFFCF